MADTKHLVFAILKFLEDQQAVGGLTEDASETLTVASQCLETTFEVFLHEDKYKLPAPLSVIFKEGISNLAAKSASVTDEHREAADKLKVEGNEFMKQDRVSDAITSYSKAIELDQFNAVYYCNRAAAYNKCGEYQKAIQDSDKALEIDPKYGKAFSRKGAAYSALKDHHQAKDCFVKALQLDPGNEAYKSSLGKEDRHLAELQGPPQGLGLGPMGPAGMGGMNMGSFDFSAFLNNPALMNMASSMMTNPQMQQMMSGMLSGSGAGNSEGGADGTGISSLLNAGQQMAQQMQQENPDLVDQMREQFRSQQGDDKNPPNPENQDGASGGSS